MKNSKKLSLHKNISSLMTELLTGVFLLAVVTVYAVSSDFTTTEARLKETADYVKEQCNNYGRLNLASETKSLMRIIQSVQQIKNSMWDDADGMADKWYDKESLQQYVIESYVTGVILLDVDGKVINQFNTDNMGYDGLLGYIDNEALMDVSIYPEKRYASRAYCDDGTYVDIAAVGRKDADGIIIAYYHTPADYVKYFNLSIDYLMSGYSVEHEGTIAVTSDKYIVASNDEQLVGKLADKVSPVYEIKKAAGSGMVCVNTEPADITRSFGLMERSRDYYIFVWMPERKVFSTAPRHLFYTCLLYIFVLAVTNMLRWKMTQLYQTEQIKMQKEYARSLKNKNDELEASLQREAKANAAKTSFLSRMTHDIRTPLNGIIGLLKINEAHSENTELVNSNREKMLVSANHLLSLINDMLQMSKLEDGEIILSHEIMDLNQLSEDIFTIVGQRAAEAGITLEYDNTSEKVQYPVVYGSPLHVRQLFLNIYGNCIKYNKVGGKVITRFENTGCDNNIVTYKWTIRDTGVGMSKEFIEHIFEPFAQEHTDARSVYNGTGLGMAIVKSLVDKMNGTISVTSIQGEGSEFTIILPFEMADETAAVRETEPDKKVSIEGVRLLIAEDNELNAEIVQMLLYDEGAAVTIVSDGQQAVDTFKDNPAGTFDAILMDVMMPKLDGLSATQLIRQMERADAKTIPIIAMTANAFYEDARKCIQAGMNAHLSKPLQMDIVISTIAKYCKKDNGEITQ